MDQHSDSTYSAIAACLFEELSQCVESELVTCKMDSNLLLQLSELDARGRKYIQQHASSFLSLKVDLHVIDKLLQRWWTVREDYEMEDQFLLLQAPQKLMRRLFGMHASTFSWRRKLLGLYGEGRHRPHYCDADTELMIWKLWHKYEHLDERQRYLKMAELTDRTIGVISAAIRRYDDAAIDRNRK